MRLGERLGYYALPPRRGQGGVVWVHAVSLGETAPRRRWCRHLRSEAAADAPAADLQHRDRRRRRARPAATRTTTRPGCPTTRRARCGAFSERYRPAVGVIMETEVWPNLMHAAQRARRCRWCWPTRGCRPAASARAGGCALLLRPALASFTRVLAQTAARCAASARVRAPGRSRSAAIPSSTSRRRPSCWRAAINGARRWRDRWC